MMTCALFTLLLFKSDSRSSDPMSDDREAIVERVADVMTWLHDRVPVTLLLDLLPVSGPSSAEIFHAEGADLSWTQAVTRDVA
jgi:hypothetical protein